MAKRHVSFPLVFHNKLGGNFIRGEKYSMNDITKLLKLAKQYTKYVLAFNRGQINSKKELDMSFCKLPPLPHQELPIKMLLYFPRAYLYGEVGVGKSFIAGYVAIKRLLDKEIDKCLILVPKVAIEQWKNELVKFFEFPTKLIGNKIVITNYESIYYHTAPEDTPIDELLKEEYRDFDMIILDEAHLVKNGYSVRAATVAQLLKNKTYRIAMTGTPIRNNPSDLFFQLSIINPWAFKCSYWQFLKEYFIEIKTGKFKKYKLRHNKAQEISKIIEMNTIKVFNENKKDIEVIFNIHSINPNSRQRELAKEVTNVTIRKGDKLFELKNELMKLQQISSGFLKYSDSYIERFESPKIERAVKKIEALTSSCEKVVVFAKFHETINRLLDRLHNIKTVTLTGKLTKAKEEIAKTEFLEGDAQVIIIQLQKGELALNLQVARHVVFVEYDWTPAAIEQAIGRVNRTGQTRDVYVDFFVTKGLIDDFIVKTVKDKNKLNTKILKRYIGNVLTKL